MNLDLLFPLSVQETRLFHLCQGCRCVQVCPAPQHKLDSYFQMQQVEAQTPPGTAQQRGDALTAPSAVHCGNGKISISAIVCPAVREHACLSSNNTIISNFPFS